MPCESDKSNTNIIDTSAKALDNSAVRRRACSKLRVAMTQYFPTLYSLGCMATTGAIRVAMRAG